MRPSGKLAAAALVAAFLIVRLSLACAASAFPAIVQKCVDGDTLILGTGQRVRLAGIDTPEKGSGQAPAQYYAEEAHRFASRSAQGKRVQVLPLSGASRDRHQRLIAEIILPDGRSLNEELLRNGMGYLYLHSNLPEELTRRLHAAQRAALDRRAGCWKKILASRDARQNYIGNSKSFRFFSPSCLRKASISPKRQRRFADLEAAFRAGYAPARQCGIWPAAVQGEK